MGCCKSNPRQAGTMCDGTNLTRTTWSAESSIQKYFITTPPSESHSNDRNAIIGGAVGGGIGFSLFLGLCLWCFGRKVRARVQRDTTRPETMPYQPEKARYSALYNPHDLQKPEVANPYTSYQGRPSPNCPVEHSMPAQEQMGVTPHFRQSHTVSVGTASSTLGQPMSPPYCSFHGSSENLRRYSNTAPSVGTGGVGLGLRDSREWAGLVNSTPAELPGR